MYAYSRHTTLTDKREIMTTSNVKMTEKDMQSLLAAYYKLLDGYTHVFVLMDSIMALLDERGVISYQDIHDKMSELAEKLSKIVVTQDEHKNQPQDVERALKFDSMFGDKKIKDA